MHTSQPIRILHKTNTFFFSELLAFWKVCSYTDFFIWKEDFGPLGNSPVLLLSSAKTPLTATVAKFLDTSVCGGSWCLAPSLSPFLVKFTQILESILLDNPHKAAVLSVGCVSFSSTLFPSTQLSVNMLEYSTLWTASFFGNECLCLTLLVKGVNDCLLDNCQISSLPHDCVAKWTKLRDHFEGSGNLCRCFELISWFGMSPYSNLLRVNWWVFVKWGKIITIKITKDLNYFYLCALNLVNTQVSQFRINKSRITVQ